MWVLAPNKAILEIIWSPKSIKIGDVTHPANIFTAPSWDDAQRAKLGIYPARVANPDKPNPFYALDGNDGGIWDDEAKEGVITQVWKPRPLPDVLTDLTAMLEAAADAERGKIGTEGTSKQAEYDQVADEARKRVIGNLADADAIMLQADVDAGLATDIDDAANKVVAAADAAKERLASIRRERRKGKISINSSPDIDAAWDAFQKIVWTK
jgi:hypothetical protein